MDPINEALNTPADADLLQRLSDSLTELSYYTQAIAQLGTLANDDRTRSSYIAATILHNAVAESVKKTYANSRAISKRLKTYMVYELLFIFVGALPVLAEIDEILHDCGITVLNALGDSPDLSISRNLTWYPDSDYYVDGERWDIIEDDEDDED